MSIDKRIRFVIRCLDVIMIMVTLFVCYHVTVSTLAEKKLISEAVGLNLMLIGTFIIAERQFIDMAIDSARLPRRKNVKGEVEESTLKYLERKNHKMLVVGLIFIPLAIVIVYIGRWLGV